MGGKTGGMEEAEAEAADEERSARYSADTEEKDEDTEAEKDEQGGKIKFGLGFEEDCWPGKEEVTLVLGGLFGPR